MTHKIKTKKMSVEISIVKSQLKDDRDIFRVGDTVKVYQKIKEGDKERIQIFEGLVIARKHGKGLNATFTVRKVTSGVGVEKIYPLHSPMIEKIEVVRSGKVRRAKIYYIRKATAKQSRLKEIKRDVQKKEKSSQKTQVENVENKEKESQTVDNTQNKEETKSTENK